MPFRACFTLLFVVLAACDTGDADLGPDPTDGIDFDRLFAPATAAEEQAVLADWAARSHRVDDARILAEDVDDTGARLVIVAHTQTDTDGSAFTHYGVVRIPFEAQNLPVLVVHHDGEDGLSMADLLETLDLFPGLLGTTVQVAPVYRAEDLDVTGMDLPQGPYAVGGAPSPLDHDVDDAVAFLNAALELFPAETDADRIGTLGFGRGAGTALLMALRDERVRVVTEYFGPTDFFDDAFEEAAEKAIEGDADAADLPGMRYLITAVLQPLDRGELSYEEARLALVRRSPALFTERLPALQIHHHREDAVVPFSQAERLDAAVQAAPNAGAYDYNPYEGALPEGAARYHDPRAMPPSLNDTEQFHQEHLIATGGSN